MNAAQCGFRPYETPERNTAALQRALDRAGTIRIDEPGIYDLSGSEATPLWRSGRGASCAAEMRWGTR